MMLGLVFERSIQKGPISFSSMVDLRSLVVCRIHPKVSGRKQHILLISAVWCAPFRKLIIYSIYYNI
jgi:hypothetical protein